MRDAPHQQRAEGDGSVIEALNRTRGRAANDAGQFTNGVDLDDPRLQPLLRRLGENICPFSPVDHVEHAKNICAALVAAEARSMR